MDGKQFLSDALSNFVFSLGQGLQAGAQYPGKRGTNAAMGAALQGPQLLAEIRRKQQLEEQDRQIRLQEFLRQVRQNQDAQANTVNNQQQQRYAMLSGQPGQEVPDTSELPAVGDQPAVPLGGTRVLPNAPIQFQPQGGQPGYSMTPRTAQEINAPKERAAQAAQVNQYNAYQLLIDQLGQSPDLKTALDELPQPTRERILEFAPELATKIKPKPTPTEYSPENITLNGKGPVLALRDKQGNFIDPTTKQPLQGKIGVYERPRETPTVVIQTVDANGNPIQKIVPKTAGAEFASKLTPQEQNRLDQADIIIREADRIKRLIDATPSAVGPIAGRIARGETVVGNVSPEAKALGTALGSFEALQPILHGFRGGSQTVEHFHNTLGDQRLNAAALKASLDQIKALATDIKQGRGQNIGTVTVTSPDGKSERTVPADQVQYWISKGAKVKK